jgi:putative endonuclease
MDTKEQDRIRKKRGQKGEDIACAYLEKKGYTILERNFRCKIGEVDIVACDAQTLAFAEVKARTRTDYGMPRDAVDRRKQWKLVRCAQIYCKMHKSRLGHLSPRMDIVEVLYTEGGTYVRHTPNAFSLGS